MKLLLLAMLTLAAAMGLSLLAQHDPGYALFAYGDWTAETSLILALLVVALTFGALLLLLRLLLGGLHLPGRLAGWQRERRARQAREATQQGLVALAEGSWAKAERLLARNAGLVDTPLLNYLGAARAAQKLGSEERRDGYLSQAHRAMPEAALAVGLTQAEVQLSDGQAERALATLMHLRGVAPHNSHVLYLLKRLFERLKDWPQLLELLPELRRHRVLAEEQVVELERRGWRELLQRYAAADDVTRLREQWQRVPRALRQERDILECYLRPLVAAGEEHEAIALIEAALALRWDVELVRAYGRLRAADPAAQLATAEGWAKQHREQPELLLTLGRLYLRNRLWGKALAALEASVGIAPQPETYCELGYLLAAMGDQEQARDCFRRGLTESLGHPCVAAGIDLGPRHAPALVPMAASSAPEVTVG